jgi:hypothetical protein
MPSKNYRTTRKRYNAGKKHSKRRTGGWIPSKSSTTRSKNTTRKLPVNRKKY